MPTFSFKVGFGRKGRSETRYTYINRIGKYEPRLPTSMISDRRYNDLVASGSGNLPSWAADDPRMLFAMSDRYERANGTSDRMIIFALPRGLLEDQVDIVEDLCELWFSGQRVHAYCWALHNPKAAIEGGDQPHVHVMYSERLIDGRDLHFTQFFSRSNSTNPSAGGHEKHGWRLTPRGRREFLVERRKNVADAVNAYLEAHGVDERVSHESYRKRGIDVTPEPRFFGDLPAKAKAIVISRQMRGEVARLSIELKLELAALLTNPVVIEFAARRALWRRAQIDPQRRPSGLLEIGGAPNRSSAVLAAEPMQIDVRLDASNPPIRHLTEAEKLRIEADFGMLRPRNAKPVGADDEDNNVDNYDDRPRLPDDAD